MYTYIYICVPGLDGDGGGLQRDSELAQFQATLQHAADKRSAAKKPRPFYKRFTLQFLRRSKTKEAVGSSA